MGAGQLPHDNVIWSRTWNNREHVERSSRSAVTRFRLLSASHCWPTAAASRRPRAFWNFCGRFRPASNALLIFDEVITGFRVDLGGAQSRWGVIPDLATYAKAVGGGVPLSVLAGRPEFMERIASGEVVHAGTLNGNPLCLAAARATIELLAADNGSIYQGMRARADRLREGIADALKKPAFRSPSPATVPSFKCPLWRSRPGIIGRRCAAQSSIV